MFARTHIGRRLSLLSAAISAIVLSFVIVVALRSSTSALQSEARIRFVERNQQVANSLSTRFDELSKTVDSLLARLVQIEAVDNVVLRQAVVDSLELDRSLMIHRVSMMRPDGAVIVFQIPDPQQGNISQQRVYRPTEYSFSESLQAALDETAGRWIIQPETLFDESGTSSVTWVLPYEFATGEAGVLWIDIPESFLETWLSTSLLEVGISSPTTTTNTYTVLLNAQGQVIVGHDLPSDISVDDLSKSSLELLETVSEVEPARYTSSDGVHQAMEPIYNQAALINDEIVSQTDWHLITVLPRTALPALASEIIPVLVFISMVGVAILVWFINSFFMQEIVRPLSTISHAAQEIGSGDMRHFIDYQTRHDEIGGLARALEDMKRNIAHSYEELSRWSRTLEQRVRERTQEADSARKQAQATATELRAIYDESLSVVGETQLRAILDAFTQRLVTLLNSSYCSIWLLNTKRTDLQLLQSTDPKLKTGDTPFTMPLSEGIAGQTIKQQQPIRVEDYDAYPHKVLFDGYDRVPFARGMSIPMWASGRVIGVVVVGRDDNTPVYTEDEQRMMRLFVNLVSPAVQNAHLLVQRDKAVKDAERANQVKTRFLASVTHELRTPLNLIINNLDFMRIGAFGDVTPEQESRLNQAIRSSEHLLYLINDLLDISKIEAGEMELFIQPTDIYTIVEDALDTAVAILERNQDKGRRITFHANVAENLPELHVDARRIRQVLSNLLSNAIKFTVEGDVIFTVIKEKDGVCFKVSDTGMGIPPDEIALLFESFERTTLAKEKNVEGTGLGLPISQFLIQQHGSELTVDSVLGEGSTFSFTLPYELPTSIVQSRKTDTQIMAVLAVDRNND